MKHTPLKRTAFGWKPRSRTTKIRTILYGKAYTNLRRERATLAGECCEDCGVSAPFVGGLDQPLWAGQLCHLDRGAKRNSRLDRVLWLCKKCHDRLDGRDVKPCPRKPLSSDRPLTA